MFDIPYKWSCCPLKNIGWIFYFIERGVRNVVRWFPVIWRDEDFDWYYLVNIMETKFRFMAEDAKGWTSVNSERDRKELLECAELLKRLKDDEWTGADGWRHEVRMNGWQERLGHLVGKKFRCWWD